MKRKSFHVSILLIFVLLHFPGASWAAHIQRIAIAGAGSAQTSVSEGAPPTASGSATLQVKLDASAFELRFALTTNTSIKGDSPAPFAAALLGLAPESSTFSLDYLYAKHLNHVSRIGIHPALQVTQSTWERTPASNTEATRSGQVLMFALYAPLTYRMELKDIIKTQDINLSFDIGYTLRAATSDDNLAEFALGREDSASGTISPLNRSFFHGGYVGASLGINAVELFVKLPVMFGMSEGDKVKGLTSVQLVAGTQVKGDLVTLFDNQPSPAPAPTPDHS